MSMDCVRRCRLHVTPHEGSVTGIGGIAAPTLGMTTVRIALLAPFPDLIVTFRIVPETTHHTPSFSLPVRNWQHLKGLKIADPLYYEPRPVDMILSSAILDAVDLGQILHSRAGSPNARLTKFGWVMSGQVSLERHKTVRFSPSTKNNSCSPKKPLYAKLASASYPSQGQEQPAQNSSQTNATSPTNVTKNAIPSQSSELNLPLEHKMESPSDRPKEITSELDRPTKPIALELEHEVLPPRSPWQRRPLFCDSFSKRSCAPENAVQEMVRSAPTIPVVTISVLPTNVKLAESKIIEPVKEPQYSQLLERMFLLEAVSETVPFTQDELKAESFFKETYSRTENGRFVVRLPFCQEPSKLGTSRMIAMRRLFQLEAKHTKRPQSRRPYELFMQDYLDAGHMELAPPLKCNQPHYYIPHHAVHRPDDPPDKIRVVFNASQKTSTGISLNELILPGPRLQLDVWKVVLRFRFDKWVFTADVRQMFRQIQHPPQDRDFLRILWRSDPREPIRDYRLTTVTYGTTSAPYLACKVLQELAIEHSHSHPLAAQILSQRTYVDDINGGGPTLKEALRTRDQLIDLLARGQLELRKWAANDPRLLQGIFPDHVLPAMSSISLEEDENGLKILGLCWNPSRDCFHFKLQPVLQITTKRELASQIAKIFDPLGWLIPMTVYVRVLFRTVCQATFHWDDPLPSSMIMDWSNFANRLPDLAQLYIPRLVDTDIGDISLVGFADASERAYAAVLYLVSHHHERTEVRLITAKARMAPMKPITLPRLELCAAHLLGRVIKQIAPLIPELKSDHIFAFSDSSIALSWITANPIPHWKVFVGNRVADITDNVPQTNWFHIASQDNPADCASRGLKPEELVVHKLWWNGPGWLSAPRSSWPLQKFRPDLSDPTTSTEIRTHSLVTNVVSDLSDLKDRLEERFSSLFTLQSVVAWSLRFAFNARFPSHRRTGPISPREFEQALLVLVRRAQAQDLPKELQDAQTDRPHIKLTKVLGLFVDHEGTLRVGGRLLHADLPDRTKHPALLPANHPLTFLIIRQAHIANLHVGPSATLAYLRNKFWIINGKNVVRRQLSHCNRCFSIKPMPFAPPMGHLPNDRTSIAPAFTITGVDYAGPFPVKIASLRSAKVIDTYLAIFVCFSSKAVHVEVVTDLSAPAFLAAYCRFVARRGQPRTIWSDNGRNFLGAANELKRLRTLLEDPKLKDALQRESRVQGTEWRFIPPRAPHFGGLWEAAVKSTKRLLKTTLGAQVPTLETFMTITTQIEAILNSRPLTALSSSPDDLQVLTPGHFLIFRPVTAPPSEVGLTERSSLKSKWAMAQHTILQFWKRWTKEYLLQEQQALKWNTPALPAQVGQIVLIMEDNLPPLQWCIGRITKLYPGRDGVPRVADVRTSTGHYQRPVRKLCPLPSQ